MYRTWILIAALIISVLPLRASIATAETTAKTTCTAIDENVTCGNGFETELVLNGSAGSDRHMLLDSSGELPPAAAQRNATRQPEAASLGPVMSLSMFDSAKDYPSVNWIDDATLWASWDEVSWLDVSGAAIDADSGYSLTEDLPINDYFVGDQGGSASDSRRDGSAVFVYRDSNGFDGDADGVFYKILDGNGWPLLADTVASNSTAGRQRMPAVAVRKGSGDFAIVWVGPSGADQAVFLREFSADGASKGNEIVVATTSSTEWAPAVAVNDAGRSVIAWRDAVDDKVRARVYDNGSPSTGVFFVFNDNNNDQFAPSVGVAANGSFVIAYQSNGAGGIQCVLFDATAAPLTTRLRANGTAAKCYAPKVAIHPELGWFAITWRDEALSVWAAYFEPTGARVEPEFQVDPGGAGAQLETATAINPSGNAFVVAWKYRPGGGGGNIQARVFFVDPPGSALTVSCSAGASCTELSAMFTASAAGGSGAYSYSWDFGDGTPLVESESGSAMHTYAVAGTYSYIVTVTNGTAGASCQQAVHVPGSDNPLAIASVSPATAAAGSTLTVTITGSGFTSKSVAKIKGTTRLSQTVIDCAHLELTVAVPAAASPGPKKVIVKNGPDNKVKRKDLFSVE